MNNLFSPGTRLDDAFNDIFNTDAGDAKAGKAADAAAATNTPSVAQNGDRDAEQQPKA